MAVGYSPVISGAQWYDTIQDINKLVLEHEETESNSSSSTSSYQGITRKHWVPPGVKTNCANKKCRKKFGLTERSHHCRRCGDLFCKECTSFQRRLNNLANPDPQGKLYKVCQECFDVGPQTLGVSRPLMELFALYRRQHRERQQRLINGEATKDFRSKFDFHLECRRLKQGFQQSLGSSSLRKSIQDIKSIIKIPEWQKSEFWVLESLEQKCRICGKDFSLVTSRNNCRVCGAAVCADCSNKDLIVFLPDGATGPEGTYENHAQLAIIKIVGCPSKEPKVCLYLRVCLTCNQRLQDDQVAKYQAGCHSDESEDVWSQVIQVQRDVTNIKSKIDHQLPQYQELIEALEITSGAPKALPKNRSNIQTLAKAQGDLSDQLTQLVMALQTLKKLPVTGRSLAVLLQNMIRSVCFYYTENMFIFRELKRNLQDITPSEVLNSIQQIVEKNAINSIYLAIKQLVFEALYLSEKHKLDDSVVVKLVSVEDVILQELRGALSLTGDDWLDHEACINELLQIQLREHRLIKPSRKLTRLQGSSHIAAILLDRTCNVILQIRLQMNAKCAERSFKVSKDSLQKLQDGLETLRESNNYQLNDFVLLS